MPHIRRDISNKNINFNIYAIYFENRPREMHVRLLNNIVLSLSITFSLRRLQHLVKRKNKKKRKKKAEAFVRFLVPLLIHVSCSLNFRLATSPPLF
ncbi:hypothetical protein PUN28_007915 [Cardiocondyla obscurior]|uniref:Uncharacterized protein n=1 Tax=Cardiocondyla obscurior TaxID=286306 RepID=A0AAW2FUX3_9HYME